MVARNPAFESKKVHGLTSVYVTDNTAQAGTARDVTGYQQLCATIMFGNVTAAATETITIKLQAGDASNGSDAADITAANFPGVDASATTAAITVSNSIDNVVYGVIAVDLSKINKTYIRAVATLSAVTTAMNCIVVFELSGRTTSITSSDYTAFINVWGCNAGGLTVDLTTTARVETLVNPVSSNATEGVTPAHVQAALRNLIIGVSATIEGFLNRHTQAATRTEYLDVAPYQRRFRLAGFPVTAVSRVNWDADQDWSVPNDMSAEDYLSPVYDARGVLELKYDLVIGNRACPRSLLVTYTGGMAQDTEAFVQAYPDIAAACDQQVAFLWHRRNDLGASSLSSEMGTITVPEVKLFIPAVRAVLERHRRWPVAA